MFNTSYTILQWKCLPSQVVCRFRKEQNKERNLQRRRFGHIAVKLLSAYFYRKRKICWRTCEQATLFRYFPKQSVAENRES